MPLFRSRKSTRKELNLKWITTYSLAGYDKHHEIYFEISPFNLGVLSDDAVRAKVFALMNVIRAIGQCELVCMNSRESFESNKYAYSERSLNEGNPIIKKLLQEDARMLDEIQLTTATARSFFICLRINEENGFQMIDYLGRIEKLLVGNGFTAKRLDRDGIKSMLNVYFTNDIKPDKIADMEGAEWYEIS